MLTGAAAAVACAAADMQRQHIEGQRKADYQALAAAKRSGHLATIQFTLDLPPELADIELTDKWVLHNISGAVTNQCMQLPCRLLLFCLLTCSWGHAHACVERPKSGCRNSTKTTL